MELFGNNISNLIDNISETQISTLPIYILIDKLDRCRPNHAISLIERIKHLFFVENIVFIIAKYTSQLKHAVSVVYGLDFNGTKYIQRFFDRIYRFDNPDTESFLNKLFHTFQVDAEKLSAPVDDPKRYFSDIMTSCHVTLRDIERNFDILQSTITLWDKDVALDLVYLLPLIILRNEGDDEGFTRIANLDVEYVKESIFFNDFSFDTLIEDSQGGRRSTVRNERVLRELMGQLTKQPIDARDSKYSYIEDIFRREFQIIHGSRFSRGGPRLDSVLLTYPALVRSSARFAEPDEDA